MQSQRFLWTTVVAASALVGLLGCPAGDGPTAPVLPSAPTGLTATATSSAEISLSWQAASGAASYRVYRDGNLLPTVATTPAHSDVGLTASTTYSYTVASCDDVAGTSCGAKSASVTATTQAAPITTYVLTVTKSGTGTGTVTSTPAGINCGTACAGSFATGTSVTLSATAGSGSSFTGWSGGGCSGTGTCVLALTAAQSVTATFTPALAQITLSHLSGAILANQQIAFTATGLDGNGNTLSGLTFTWASSAPTVASVTSTGLATGVTIGTTNITASAGEVTSAPAPVMVVTLGSHFSPADVLTGASVATGPSGDVNLVWRGTQSGTSALFFVRSTDGGQTFALPPSLPKSDIPSSPRVAVGPNGNIFVAWGVGAIVDDLFGDIALSVSGNGGNSFSSNPVNVTNNVSSIFGVGASTGSQSGMAIDQSGNVHVVTTLWRSLSDANYDVIYSRSTNGGASFSGPTVVYENLPSTDNVFDVAVATSGTNVYITWMQGGGAVLFVRSTNGGTTFSSPVSLGQGSCFLKCTHIGIDGTGAMTVVWLGSDGLYFARSANSGASFSPATKIPLTKFADSSPHSTVDAQGRLYVVWTRVPPEASSIQRDIFFTRSTDGGATFSVPVNMSGTFDAESQDPWIAVDGSENIHVIWLETTAGSTYNVAYRRAK